MNPVHNSLNIAICEDAETACGAGFDYSQDPSIKPIEVEQVVVVRNGTAEGRPTVDFVLRAEDGQRYVFMVTGRLLKNIPC